MRGWRRPLLAGLAAAAAVFAAAELLLEGPQRWQRWSPYPGERIAAAVAEPGSGRVYAAARSGALLVHEPEAGWRLHAGNLPGEAPPLALAAHGGGLLLGTLEGLYRSPASGEPAWRPYGDGLPAGLPVFQLRLAPDGRGLLTSPEAGVYTSGDGGAHWRPLGTAGLPAQARPYRALALADGGHALATVGGAGVYRLAPGAERWRPDAAGLPAQPRVFSLVALPGGGMLIGTERGAYRQAEAGRPWRPAGERREGFRILDLALGPAQRIWAASDAGGYVSTAPATAGSAPGRWRGLAHDPLVDPASDIQPGEPPLLVAGAVYRLAPDAPAGRRRSALLALLAGAGAAGAAARRRSPPPTAARPQGGP